MTESCGVALPIGSTLLSAESSYRLDKILGVGGFGIAYKAQEIGGLQRGEVAIKEFFPQDIAIRNGTNVEPYGNADNYHFFAKGLRAFGREARLLAQFYNDYVVRVITHFEANGTGYIVMEYLPGQSLQAYMENRGRCFSEAEALKIIRPILSGLQSVHERKIWHLDIKPGNIYLAQIKGLPESRPTLLDFGAARQEFGTASQSIETILTRGYAPFEQYLTNGNIGPWSDIYALCATLYQMLGGIIPPESSALKEGNAILKPLNRLNPAISKKLSDLIMRGLAIESHQRPQSAGELLKLLESNVPKPKKTSWMLWASGGLLIGSVIGLLTKLIPNFFVGLAIIVAVLLGAGYFYMVWKQKKIEPKQEPIKLFFCVESSRMFLDQSIPLQQELLLGRNREYANIVLPHQSISGKHAKFSPIESKPGWCRVTDMDSKFKTYYSVPGELGKWRTLEGSVELKRGSRICLANEQAAVIELR